MKSAALFPTRGLCSDYYGNEWRLGRIYFDVNYLLLGASVSRSYIGLVTDQKDLPVGLKVVKRCTVSAASPWGKSLSSMGGVGGEGVALVRSFISVEAKIGIAAGLLSFDRCLFCFGGAWLVVVDDHWVRRVVWLPTLRTGFIALA